MEIHGSIQSLLAALKNEHAIASRELSSEDRVRLTAITDRIYRQVSKAMDAVHMVLHAEQSDEFEAAERRIAELGEDRDPLEYGGPHWEAVRRASGETYAIDEVDIVEASAHDAALVFLGTLVFVAAEAESLGDRPWIRARKWLTRKAENASLLSLCQVDEGETSFHLGIAINGETVERNGKRVLLKGNELALVSALYAAGEVGATRQELQSQVFHDATDNAFDKTKARINGKLTPLGVEVARYGRGIWRLSELQT